MRRTMKNDGFSLIEVMVAMVIVGVALMGTLVRWRSPPGMYSRGA